MADSSTTRAQHVSGPLLVGAIVAGLALATFFAFDAWRVHGADMVLALSTGGLSWCM